MRLSFWLGRSSLAGSRVFSKYEMSYDFITDWIAARKWRVEHEREAATEMRRQELHSHMDARENELSRLMASFGIAGRAFERPGSSWSSSTPRHSRTETQRTPYLATKKPKCCACVPKKISPAPCASPVPLSSITTKPCSHDLRAIYPINQLPICGIMTLFNQSRT